MRTRGSYIGHFPETTGAPTYSAIDGVFPLNQTFSLRGDSQWPTARQILSLSLSTTSLNETDNKTLTVTIQSKGFNQNLYAHIVPESGSNLTVADFSTPQSNLYIAFNASPRDEVSTDTVTIIVAEDETDETPDTEQFRIEIRALNTLNSVLYATSDIITINDTSTVSPFTIFETNWVLPANTNQGSSWLSSGTVTVTNGQAGAGYWVWIMDDIDGFRSDLQLNDFTFNSNISSGAVGNTTTALNALFETTTTSAHSVFSTSNALNAFKNATFTQVTTGTASNRCNTSNSAPPSSGTGISDGSNYFVYFETSGSGSNREMMLRTEKMTYTSSPTCSFSYALYSTTSSDVGRTRLFWIEDNT